MTFLTDLKLTDFIPFNKAIVESNEYITVRPTQNFIVCGLKIPNVSFTADEYNYSINITAVNCKAFFVIETNGKYDFKKRLENGNNIFNYYSSINNNKMIKIVLENVKDNASVKIMKMNIVKIDKNVKYETIEISESVINNAGVNIKQEENKQDIIEESEIIEEDIKEEKYFDDKDIDTNTEIYVETITESINNKQEKKQQPIFNKRMTLKQKQRVFTQMVSSNVKVNVHIDYHGVIDDKKNVVDYSYRFTNKHLFISSKFNKYQTINSHIEMLEYLTQLSTNNNVFLVSEKSAVPINNFNYQLLDNLANVKYDIAILSHTDIDKKQTSNITNKGAYYYPGAYVIKRNFIPTMIKLLKNKIRESEINVFKQTEYEMFDSIIKSNINNFSIVSTPIYFKTVNMNYLDNFYSNMSLIVYDNGDVYDSIKDLPKDIETIIISNSIFSITDRPYIIINTTTTNYSYNYQYSLQFTNGKYVSFVYSSWKLPKSFFTVSHTLTLYNFKFHDTIFKPYMLNIAYSSQAFIIKNDRNVFNIEPKDYSIEKTLASIRDKEERDEIVECDNIICAIKEQEYVKSALNSLVMDEINGKSEVDINNLNEVNKELLKTNNDMSYADFKHITTEKIINLFNSNVDLSKDTFTILSSDNYVNNSRELNIARSISKWFNVIYVISKKSTDIIYEDNVFYIPINIYKKIVDIVSINKVIVYYNDPEKFNEVVGINRQYTVFDLTSNIFMYAKYANIFNDEYLIDDIFNNVDLVLYSSKKFENICAKYKSQYLPNAYFEREINNINEKELEEIKKKDKIIVGYCGYINNDIDFNVIKMIASNDKVHVVILGGLGTNMDNKFNSLHISLSNEQYNLSFPHSNITWIPFKQNNLEYIKLFDIALLPFKSNNMTLTKNPTFLYEAIYQQKPILSTIDYSTIESLNVELFVINKETLYEQLNKCIQLVVCDIESNHKKIEVMNNTIDNTYDAIQNEFITSLNDRFNKTKYFDILYEDKISDINKYVIDSISKMLIENGYEKNSEKATLHFTSLLPIEITVDNLIIVEYDNFDIVHNGNDEERIDVMETLTNALMIITDNKPFIDYVKHNNHSLFNKIQYIEDELYVSNVENDLLNIKNIYAIVSNETYDNIVKVFKYCNLDINVIKESFDMKDINNKTYQYPIILESNDFIYNKLSRNNIVIRFNGYINLVKRLTELFVETKTIEDNVKDVLIDNCLITNSNEYSRYFLSNNFLKYYDREYIEEHFNEMWKSYVMYYDILKDGAVNKELANVHFGINDKFEGLKVINRDYDFNMCIIIGKNLISYQTSIINILVRYFNCNVYSYGANEIDNNLNILYKTLYNEDEVRDVVNYHDFILYYDMPLEIREFINKKKYAELQFNNNINESTNYITFFNDVYVNVINMHKNDNVICTNIDHFISNTLISNLKRVKNPKKICCVANINDNDEYNDLCNIDSYIKAVSRMKVEEVDIVMYNTLGVNIDSVNDVLNRLHIKGNIFNVEVINDLVNKINEYETVVIPDKSNEFNIAIVISLLLNKKLIVASSNCNIEFNALYKSRSNDDNNIYNIFNYNDIESLKRIIENPVDVDYEKINKYLNNYYLNDELFIGKMFYAILKCIF